MARTRSESQDNSVATLVTKTYADGGFRLPDETGNTTSKVEKSMTDVVTPDFKKLRSKGRIINSSMSMVEEKIEDYVSSWYNYLGLSITSNGTTPDTGFIDQGTMPTSKMKIDPVGLMGQLTTDKTTLVDLAASKAWANIDSSSAAMLVTIAEAKKTYASISSILYRSFSIFRAIKRGELARARNLISQERLDNIYLEARYAIRPLFYDAKGIVEAFNKKRVDKTRYTARGSAEGSDSASSSTRDTGAFASVYIRANYSGSVRTKVRAYILYEIDASKLSNLQTWGLVDPFSAGYELIPFSFIADWFCNLGTVIASWNPKPFVNVLASGYTSETIYSLIGNGYPEIKPNYYSNQTARGRSCSGNGSLVRMIRYKERVPALPKPILPHLDVNLNFLKILDLVLILRKLI